MELLVTYNKESVTAQSQPRANPVQTFNAHNMQKEKYNQILFKTV